MHIRAKSRPCTKSVVGSQERKRKRVGVHDWDIHEQEYYTTKARNETQELRIDSHKPRRITYLVLGRLD